MSTGQRLEYVRRGGRIRFQGVDWVDPALLSRVGQVVLVRPGGEDAQGRRLVVEAVSGASICVARPAGWPLLTAERGAAA